MNKKILALCIFVFACEEPDNEEEIDQGYHDPIEQTPQQSKFKARVVFWITLKNWLPKVW